MKARIENHTHFSIRTIKRAVRWVLRELDLEDRPLRVVVKLTDMRYRMHHGRFNAYGPTIFAYIPELPSGGLVSKYKSGPPPFYPETWLECLVCIIAHEAMHMRQFQKDRKGETYTRIRYGRQERVRGRRYSEPESEWAEYRLLRRWRAENGNSEF